jgi:c-di-GMP-related signal transduction protein
MSTTEALNRFLARQPILTAEKQLFGYEILSRYGPENYCRQTGTSQFHVNAMDELFLMGITAMTEGLPAFMNCTREFLVNDYLTLMPKEMVVGEILETVAADEEVMAACKRMKDQGYRFALDDYCDVAEVGPLMDFADLVKIDVRMTSFEEQKRLIGKCHE